MTYILSSPSWTEHFHRSLPEKLTPVVFQSELSAQACLVAYYEDLLKMEGVRLQQEDQDNRHRGST